MYNTQGVTLVAVAVLEHFTWGGKGGARGHARVAWEGGPYVVFYTVTYLLLNHALTQVFLMHKRNKVFRQTNKNIV